MGKVRVNLTMFAEPVEVDESEVASLRSQGILTGVEGDTAEHPEDPAFTPPAASETAAKTGTKGKST